MWIRLDDNFADHPKTIAAGLQSAWTFVVGLLYANRHMTNGFVPDSEVEPLTRLCGKLSRAERAKIVAKLVRVGFWSRIRSNGTSGYQIHDYLDYQPSRKQIQKSRRVSRLRQKRWRAAKQKRSRRT